jgi:hypothetical protein
MLSSNMLQLNLILLIDVTFSKPTPVFVNSVFGDLSSSLHSIENGSLAKSLLEHTLMLILDCHCSVIEMRLMGIAAHLRPNVQLSPELVP